MPGSLPQLREPSPEKSPEGERPGGSPRRTCSMAVGAARCRAGVAAAALLLSVAAAGAGQAQPSPPAADAVLTRSLTAAERHFGPQARQLLPILARLRAEMALGRGQR